MSAARTRFVTSRRRQTPRRIDRGISVRQGPNGRLRALLLIAAGALVCALGALRLLDGCGGGGGTSPDGENGDAGSSGVEDGGVLTVTCDPVAQTGCGAAQKCDLFCGANGPELGCRIDQGGLQGGQACVPSATTGAATCVKGTSCLTSHVGTSCTTFCAGDAGCAPGSCVEIPALLTCFADPTKNKSFAVNVCQP